MLYKSAKTEKGNVGISYESQSLADAQAREMDAGNNVNCYDCSNCSDCFNCSNCSDCFNCFNCYNCSDCFNCSNCSDCLNCFNCYNCSNCFNCSNCSGCSGCSNCSGILKWNGPKTDKLLALNGLRWPVATNGTHIQIGCQQHSVGAWASFSDTDISKMSDNALKFWRQFKPTIMAMAAYRASLGE